MPTTRPQNGKVSCAAGPARPDGKLIRKATNGCEQPVGGHPLRQLETFIVLNQVFAFSVQTVALAFVLALSSALQPVSATPQLGDC